MHLLLDLWVGFMLFLIGATCGMLAAWRRYALAIEDRDHRAQREAAKVAGFMIKGVEFNQQILTLLQLQNVKAKLVSVDWDLLTQAANGAGFTIVKAKPRATERVN